MTGRGWKNLKYCVKVINGWPQNLDIFELDKTESYFQISDEKKLQKKWFNVGFSGTETKNLNHWTAEKISTNQKLDKSELNFLDTWT